ncbi:YugN family protein [Anaerobacillus sp. MEB173]|uniref:YugN family protein n=1 Tax=Anaerobacillus sp. MEB173 TaxID=3383345 RepID=UPI003F921EAA
MKFESIGLADKEAKFSNVEHVMAELGFIHAGQWDYERVTFDYKFEDLVKNEIYYLRVQAYATKGEIPSSSAQIKFLIPILGKYYYPHGVEYEGEEFPKNIVDKSTQKLQAIKDKLAI